MGAGFYICFYHDKRTYSSAHKAYREASRTRSRRGGGNNEPEDFNVFWCSRTGGYHLTSITQAEMDRRQAAHNEGHGVHAHEKFQEYKKRTRRSSGLSPKIVEALPTKRKRVRRTR